MSESTKAVFLSYASQDSEAAKRICDALRASGVEVWFDQSELVGGDQWDGKIRGQISSCALFVPIISANSQARLEGYFRLEWKLAAQRTHTMADEMTFLLPVVIDGTRDAEARVPAEFKSVQWTKLPNGETPPAFAQRVKKLLGGDGGRDLRIPPSSGEAGFGDPALQKKRRPWLVPAIIGAVVIAVATVWLTRKPVSAPASSPPGAVAVPAAALSEAQKLVAQARSIYDNGDELNRENIFFADDLVKRALALDPADPAAWELAAWLSYTMSWQGFDNSDARREMLMRQAARAMALAPSSVSAQLVMINARMSLNFASSALGPNKVVAESERELLALAAREPGNWQVQRALGQTYRFLNRPDDSIPALRRAVELSQGRASAVVDLTNVLVRLKRYDEAEAILAPVLARQPTGRVLSFDLLIKCRWQGDLAGAQAALQTWPSWLLQEDRGAFWAWEAWMYSRQPDKALAAALRLQRDYLHDANFTGPRAVLTARAHELAGHAEAARAEWRTVVQVTDRELAGNPDDPAALYWKTWALTRLGETAAAQVNGTLLRQRTESNQMSFFKGTNIAALWVTTGQAELAFQAMHQQLKEFNDSYGVTRAMLELDPAYDPVRDDPRFKEIVQLAPAPAKESGAGSRVAVDQKSIAVLAFANLSDDKGNEYFSDGISEELLNVLAKVPGLKVSARTSAFFFKGKEVPIPEIAQKLGVAYVVEGSVRKQGDKVRITAQLIKAADGFHVWSDTFTRDLKDIFAVQDEIAGLIAQNLRLRIGSAPAVASVDPEAFRLLLAGRAKIRQGGNANRDAAIEDIRRAVVVAPNYAAAWAELARAFIEKARTGRMDLDAAFGEARAAARKAAALAPEAPEVLVTLGWVRRTADWDWRGAQEAFRRALALYPDYPDAVSGAAVLFNNLGYVEESLQLGQRAVELDPLNAEAHYNLSFFLSNIDRNAEAAAALRRALALAPEADGYHRFLANVLADQGLLEDAERELALEPEAAARLHGQAVILVRRDRKAEALTIIRKMETEINFDLDRAEIYALAGEYDLAFMALERGYNQHGTGMVWLKVDSYLRNLHGDARWSALLRKMGLADEQLK